MRCSKCGFENPTMKFCGQCAEALALICPKCRFENPPGFKFCGQCTTPLQAAAPVAPQAAEPQITVHEAASGAALDGERKTVTALFADIKGSTELAGAIMVHIASTLMLLGRVTDARASLEEGLRKARESGHLFSLGHALTVSGWLGRYRREPELALARAAEAIALSEEHGMTEWHHWGQFHHGWALAELGQLEEGIAETTQGIAGFRETGGVPRQQYVIACFARSLARVGRTQESLALLNEALAHVERTGERVDLAEMLRLKSEVILTHDPSATDDAERDLRAAIDVSRAQGARWWELRTATSLARLLRDTNRRDQAHAMLSEIYNWFTEGFDAADLKEAAALLEELNS
ncbi:MAG TPA: zinc ribbon domain-containing protein [Candidatus Binataceae bacterium]|nr:zinc ribbon domain-containing protein [Candidatus Binataceae bacterium]